MWSDHCSAFQNDRPVAERCALGADRNYADVLQTVDLI